MDLTKDQFFAYLLLYAAKADTVETPEETAFILSKVPESTYSTIHKIFDMDTDQERIERILENVSVHNYSQNSPEELLEEIKAIMKSDGRMDSAERSVLLGLRRLFSSL